MKWQQVIDMANNSLIFADGYYFRKQCNFKYVSEISME